MIDRDRFKLPPSLLKLEAILNLQTWEQLNSVKLHKMSFISAISLFYDIFLNGDKIKRRKT